jgi:ATP/maltotriose-dependent transcriptional regulator MalT/two-component SAPR family response regulator
MAEIIRAKLRPPQVGKEIIHRPRLIDDLLNGFEERKLTLLQAPAGYGKTVLMLQLSNAVQRALVWYQLDIYDNDPVVFLQSLIAGIRRQLPEFGLQAQQLIEEGGIENRLRLLVTAIVNGLSQANRPLLLVLDDYQVISEPIIQRFMQDFLEHLPICIHVMIAGRALPPLNISRLKTQSEVVNVGIEDLRFTDDETKAFLSKKSLQLSSQTRRFLEQKINGWPAALKLAADAAGNTDLPLQISRGTAEIYSYLANEILEKQPPEIRAFLLDTAVLETITPENCNLLLERNDSRTVLDYLEKQQLFLIPLAGPAKAYRYHQLFRDFLLEQLGAGKNLLLRKAGAMALRNGDLDQAVEYYIPSGMDGELLPLLEKACKDAFRQGRWQTVERWLGLFPREQIAADAWLSFFQAQIKFYQGKLDQVESWIRNALAHFSTRRDMIGIAECQFLQARIFNGHGRHRDSLYLLEQAYPVLHEAQPFLRFDLPLEMGISLFRNGRFQEAEELLTRSLQEAERQNEFWMMAHLLEGLGNINFWIGEHSKALQYYQKGIRISPRRTLPSYNFQDFIASIYLEWGEFDRAFEYALRSVTIKESLGMMAALPTAYYQLGSTYVDRGELAQAEACYRKGIDLAEHGGGLHYLSLNKAYLANCLCLQGRLAESLACAEQVLALARNQSATLLATCQVQCVPAFIESGDIVKAKHMLLEALPPLEQWRFAKPLSYCYTYLAFIDFQAGDLPHAEELSRKLLDLAARKNLVRLFLAVPQSESILRYGMENEVEVYFIQQILARLGKRAIPLLASLAQHQNPQVRYRAIIPLSELGTETAVSMLKALSKDPDPALRQLAGEVLEKFDPATSELQFKSADDILELKTLGSLRIFNGGAEITALNWRTLKTRDLLAFFAHQRYPVAKETILEELWPDHELEKSQGLFHTSLYYLRQILDKIGHPDLIFYQNKHYALAAKTYTTDRIQFQELITAGFNDETPLEKAADFLERAIALYTGDYLQELDYLWILPDREYLKNFYFEARLRLARHYLHQKDFNPAIHHLQILAGLDSLSEEIHRLLMTAYAGLGHHSAVREQYALLRAVLKNELGIEPSHETAAVYNRLCRIESPD